MDQLKNILQATLSPDQNELQAAQKYLENASEQEFPAFLSALSVILADINETPLVRQAAGIQLKNCLVAKDASVKQAYNNRWYALEASIKVNVKAHVFKALGTETTKPSSAASCLAGIASAELPLNLWPELMEELCKNTTLETNSDSLIEATLESIGYICQDIDASFLSNYAAVILRAIVMKMGNEVANNNIRLAATTAFLNSLEFIRGNFEKPDDRNFIMTVVCQASQCGDKRVKIAALQSLVKIVSIYYEHMESYMGPALFAITVDAMKSEEDDVVLQGVEFWSSVCDEEIELSIEASEAQENGTHPEHFSRFYAKGALQHLVPLLLAILTKQEESDDDEDWSPHKASGVCIMLLASCCPNEIVANVTQFIETNIQSTDWKFRDAAVMAFGSILEGPDTETLGPIVNFIMPYLMLLMKDTNMNIRDSVAWSLSRICDQVPEAALNTGNIENLLNTLIENLDSEPRVASNVCWAFTSLADAAFESAQPTSEDDEEPTTYILSPKFEFIVTKIIETGDRGDAHMSNLRSSAYEAVMELVKNSPKDVYPTIQKTILAILNKIDAILKMEAAGGHVGDHSQLNDFKSLLCAALQATLRKLKTEDLLKVSDNCMKAILEMLNMSNKVGGVQEDAFMAVGCLIECIGQGFNKYMETFIPFLIEGLRNKAEYQVCISAMGVVGDLCRGIGSNIELHCDSIMSCCVENIADPTIHRSVKPPVLSLFGDVALAIGPKFVKYAEVVLTTLYQASLAQVDKNDFDMIDYLNELRDACLEAYTGIVQGLKGDDEQNVATEVDVVKPHVEGILKFIELISQDPERTDNLVGACCGLLGDICTTFGAPVVQALNKPCFNELLQEGRRSKTSKTKTLAVWASKTIRNLRK